MDPIYLGVAFVLGFAVSQIGLPPLVGFLAAGFVLQAGGAESGEAIEKAAEFGVILLLFSIGLKLKIKSLLRPEIWGGAVIHMIITVILFTGGIALFGGESLEIAVLIAFALNFSSTVFAVQVLEGKGEMDAFHGRVSIGLLIMQDIIAVAFLTFSKGIFPSPWALAIIPGLFLLRPILFAVLTRSGHGELLMLLGLLIPISAAGGFEALGLKPDLGALVIGVFLAGHAKAPELSKTLLNLKDLLLVGFFLSIGLSEAPTWNAFLIASVLTVAVPVKVALFMVVLTRFKLRTRTSLLASFSLANYSEFGLIVAYVGVQSGWLGSEWLVIIAIALSLTFVLASPLNAAAHKIYARIEDRIQFLETDKRLPDDRLLDPGDAEIVIFGMGKVGASAYDALRKRFGKNVLGVDFNALRVDEHRTAGRNIVLGDATDPDFWERFRPGGVKLVMLALMDQSVNMDVARRLKERSFAGLIAAAAQYDDHLEALTKAGVDMAFDLIAEAGAGYAEHVCREYEKRCET